MMNTTDISRSDATEAVSDTLRRTWSAYQWVFEEGADCAKLHDRDGRILSVNRNGLCSLELDDIATIQGVPWAEIWPEEMRPKIEAVLRSAREGQINRFTAFCPTAKGTPKWWSVLVTPIFDADGNVKNILTVGSDITELERTKEALRTEVARMEFILQAGQIGEWEIDLSTGNIQRSPQYDQCFGYTEQLAEWNREIFLQHVHPEDRPRVSEQLDIAGNRQGAFKCECRVVWPDRSVHWILLHGAIYRSAEDQPIRLLGTIADITQRKRADALANGQKQALEMAVTGAPLNQVLDVLTLAAEASTGHTVMASVLLLDKDGQHLRHGSAPSLPATFSKLLDGVPIYPAIGPCGTVAYGACEVIVQNIATDGRWSGFGQLALPYGLHSCWSQPILSSRGTVLGTMAAYRDRPWEPTTQDRESMALLVNTAALVLDRRREAEERDAAEAALRKSQAHLSSLFGQSMAGIVEMDLSGRFIEVNDRYCQMLGRTREDLIGQLMLDLTHPDDRQSTLELFARLLETGNPFEIEKRYARPDGTYTWVTAAVNRIHTFGCAESVLAVVTDITARKLAEDGLREADRRKDEFLAMLAHELRNPLSPIASAAELLSFVGNDAKKVRQACEVISRQVRHMTGLIDDLLDVSRVTRGLVKLDKVTLDVKTVMTEAIEQVKPLIEARGHSITMHLDADDVCIHGDKKRLVQVLANLLNNAAKYTPEGGAIALSMEASDTHVALSVRDNGIGLEPELLHHVFEPFVQAQRSADRSQGGLGIGLALVKHLIDVHGGSVSVSSQGRGKGAVFTVTLPRLLAKNHCPLPAPASLGMSESSGAFRLLVVDDNIDAAEMIGMFLEASGHEVAVAHDPATALAIAEKTPFDACLLDIGLPGMDGYELARRLRECSGTGESMLVTITGYGQDLDREKALAAGFAHHFVKPVDVRQLSEVIVDLAGRKRRFAHSHYDEYAPHAEEDDGAVPALDRSAQLVPLSARRRGSR